jgi:hypothetical protein
MNDLTFFEKFVIVVSFWCFLSFGVAAATKTIWLPDGTIIVCTVDPSGVTVCL